MNKEIYIFIKVLQYIILSEEYATLLLKWYERETVIIIGKINAKQQIWYQLKINFDKTTKF